MGRRRTTRSSPVTARKAARAAERRPPPPLGTLRSASGVTATAQWSRTSSRFGAARRIVDLFAPVAADETPAALVRAARGFVVAVMILLPCLYDGTVGEAASLPRWTLVHAASFALATLLALILAHGRVDVRLATRPPALVVAMIVFAGCAALSLVVTVDPLRSSTRLIQVLSATLLGLGVALLYTPKWSRGLGWALALPVALNGPLMIAQAHGLDGLLTPGGIVHGALTHFAQATIPAGTFVNRNLAASWLVLVLPVVVWLALTVRSRAGLLVASALLFVASEALLSSASRSAWLGAAVATCVGIAVVVMGNFRGGALRSAFPRARACAVAACLALPIAIDVIASLAGAFEGRLVGRLAAGASGTPAVTAAAVSEPGATISTDAAPRLVTGDPRIAFWLNSAAVVADHPLLGIGVGAFQSIYPKYQRARATHPMQAHPSLVVEHAHSDVVQAFVETGVPGGLALVALLGLAVLVGLVRGGHGDTAAPFLSLGVLGLAVTALLDFPLQMPTALALLLVVCGWLAGIGHTHASRPEATWQMSLSPAVGMAGAGVIGVIGAVVAADDLRLRSSRQLASLAEVRAIRGLYDDETLRFAREAQARSPRDPHARFLYAVAVANHAGGASGQDYDAQIEVLSALSRYERWFPVTAANLGAILFEKALLLQISGRAAEARPVAARVRAQVEILRQVSPHSVVTWCLSGMAALVEGQPQQAREFFARALALQPGFAPAMVGISFAEHRAAGLSAEETLGRLGRYPRLRLGL